jgi:hypothetical protein
MVRAGMHIDLEEKRVKVPEASVDTINIGP